MAKGRRPWVHSREPQIASKRGALCKSKVGKSGAVRKDNMGFILNLMHLPTITPIVRQSGSNPIRSPWTSTFPIEGKGFFLPVAFGRRRCTARRRWRVTLSSKGAWSLHTSFSPKTKVAFHFGPTYRTTQRLKWIKFSTRLTLSNTWREMSVFIKKLCFQWWSSPSLFLRQKVEVTLATLHICCRGVAGSLRDIVCWAKRFTSSSLHLSQEVIDFASKLIFKLLLWNPKTLSYKFGRIRLRFESGVSVLVIPKWSPPRADNWLRGNSVWMRLGSWIGRGPWECLVEQGGDILLLELCGLCRCERRWCAVTISFSMKSSSPRAKAALSAIWYAHRLAPVGFP